MTGVAGNATNSDMDRRTFLTSAPRHLLEGLRALMADLRGLSPTACAVPGDSTIGAAGRSVLDGQARTLPRRVAILDVARCLAWGGGSCQVCYLRCPLRDHAMVLEDGKPTVVASVCDGCSVCVEVCHTVNDLEAIEIASI